MPLADSAASFELTDGVLTVSGEIGLHEERDFERAVKDLLNSGSTDLVLDLSSLTYMNSSCVRIVAEAFARAKKKNIEITATAHVPGKNMATKTVEGFVFFYFVILFP